MAYIACSAQFRSLAYYVDSSYNAKCEGNIFGVTAQLQDRDGFVRMGRGGLWEELRCNV